MKNSTAAVYLSLAWALAMLIAAILGHFAVGLALALNCLTTVILGLVCLSREQKRRLAGIRE